MPTLSSRFALFLLTAVLAVAAASAESLWTERSQSLYVDTKARTVGDLLTVLIAQHSSSSTQARHTTGKTFDASLEDGTGLLDFIPGFGVTGNRKTDGMGSASSSTLFSDRLTVKVVEVLPNGNFRVEGTRTITLEKDTMNLVFSGIVRQEDIAPDNTVDSILVADQRLEARGFGPIAEKQRPGILSRLLSLIW